MFFALQKTEKVYKIECYLATGKVFNQNRIIGVDPRLVLVQCNAMQCTNFQCGLMTKQWLQSETIS